MIIAPWSWPRRLSLYFPSNPSAHHCEEAAAHDVGDEDEGDDDGQPERDADAHEVLDAERQSEAVVAEG